MGFDLEALPLSCCVLAVDVLKEGLIHLSALKTLTQRVTYRFQHILEFR